MIENETSERAKNRQMNGGRTDRGPSSVRVRIREATQIIYLLLYYYIYEILIVPDLHAIWSKRSRGPHGSPLILFNNWLPA